MRRVLGAAMVVWVIAGRADAQSGDSSAIAEQLFNEARELAKANQWAEACPKFEASLRYDPVLGTRLNLATCYEHIGKLASAWSLYRESVELAKKAGDIKRRDYAQKQAAALESRLPKLAISAPVKPPSGFVVTRDGTRIDAGVLGVALYVDPGAHEITATAPGFEAFTQTVSLAEGKVETLAIPNLKAVPAPDPRKPPGALHAATIKPVTVPPSRGNIEPAKPVAAPSPGRNNVAATAPVATPSPPRKNAATTTTVIASSTARNKDAMTEPVASSPTGGSSATNKPVTAPSLRGTLATTEPVVARSPTRKYIVIGLGAAGVAAVGVGFLFGAKANSTYSDAKGLCGANLVCTPANYQKGKQLIGDARSSATISTVFVAAGGAAVIASAVVFLTAPSSQEHTTARIVPMAHDHGAGLAVTGEF